jgi:hypothetical protein
MERQKGWFGGGGALILPQRCWPKIKDRRPRFQEQERRSTPPHDLRARRRRNTGNYAARGKRWWVPIAARSRNPMTAAPVEA